MKIWEISMQHDTCSCSKIPRSFSSLLWFNIYRLQIHLNVQHWTNIARIPTCKILTISKIKDTLYMLKHIPKLTYCLQTHYKVILGNFSFSTSILFLWIKLITNVQDFFFVFLDPVIKLLKTRAGN